jgi:hypothetical protein
MRREKARSRTKRWVIAGFMVAVGGAGIAATLPASAAQQPLRVSATGATPREAFHNANVQCIQKGFGRSQFNGVVQNGNQATATVTCSGGQGRRNKGQNGNGQNGQNGNGQNGQNGNGQNGQNGNGQNGQNGNAVVPTVNCPQVNINVAIPAQAQAEVNSNLQLLNTQIAEANNRLRTSVGQGGPNFAQNAILGPLGNKRFATINRIETAIGRNAPKPNLNAEGLSTCTLNR